MSVSFFRDVSLSAAVAGLVAVLVGFTSSIALVFQAAQAFGATPAQTTSWVLALSWGVGLCCILPSLRWRMPVMVAWSTPGAAVLAAGGTAGGFSMADAVGAFIGCALLIMLSGWSGIFERLMARIPVALASALLAGVLAKFGLDAIAATPAAWQMVLPMLLAYVLAKQLWARYAVVLTLLVGLVAAFSMGQLQAQQLRWAWAVPQWTSPVFSWQAFVSLALPLFVVTMASQNLPGVMVMQAAGYRPAVSRLVGWTGVATLLLAPFGGYAFNFAAITAAICTGQEAHPDPSKRYAAAVVCGLVYLFVGLGAAVVTGLLLAVPQALVLAIAALALLSSIGNGLAVALADEQHREAALITFLVTLSGVVVAGVGAAFWGVVAGGSVLGLQRWLEARR